MNITIGNPWAVSEKGGRLPPFSFYSEGCGMAF